MDKQTLSNYGWIVICVLVLAVMIALATPFGSFVKSAVETTTEAFYSTQRNALVQGGIRLKDLKFQSAQEKFDKLTSGKEIPSSFYYGDYKYTRSGSSGNYTWSVRVNTEFTGTEPTLDISITQTDKDREEYGEILGSAFGYPITSLISTFADCVNLLYAPEIPNGATTMIATFNNCSSLKEAPAIPNSVTMMAVTFDRCSSLTKAPDLSGLTNLVNLSAAFQNCTSLVNAPVLPSGVSDINHIFYGCTALTGTIVINCNPTSYNDWIKGRGTTPNVITITGSSTKLAELKADGGDYVVIG